MPAVALNQGAHIQNPNDKQFGVFKKPTISFNTDLINETSTIPDLTRTRHSSTLAPGFTGTLPRSPPSSTSLFTDDLISPRSIINSSAITATQYTLFSTGGFTGTLTGTFPRSPSISLFSVSSFTTSISFITRSETPLSITTSSQAPISGPASTLSTSAKFGIGIGAFLGLIIMILLSILLWRSKRRHRISKKKPASIRDNQFAKAELDAVDTQRPDQRARELSGDMAHELAGGSERNEIWELPENTVQELADHKDTYEDEARLGELSKDIAYELSGGNSDKTEVRDRLAR